MAKKLNNEGKLENDDSPSTPQKPKMSAADFQKLGGEQFLGKSILQLNPGEADGPFTLVEILKDQNLNAPGSKKKLAPVDVYVGKNEAGIKVNMPVAASFIAKAQEANLAVGDVFAVLRLDDYTSRAYGTKGKGFALTIISRAKPAKK